MQHFIHFSIKLGSRQKYRHHTGMFAVAQMRQRFIRLQAVRAVCC